MIHAMNELPPEIQSQPFMSYYEELLESVIDIKNCSRRKKLILKKSYPCVLLILCRKGFNAGVSIQICTKKYQ